MTRLRGFKKAKITRLREERQTLGYRFKSGPVTTAIIIIALACLLSLFFLIQVFQTSTKGYQISDLKAKAQELKESNKNLEIKAAELRSFENIRNEAEELNMVEADKIVYIRAGTASVAVANR